VPQPAAAAASMARPAVTTQARAAHPKMINDVPAVE